MQEFTWLTAVCWSTGLKKIHLTLSLHHLWLKGEFSLWNIWSWKEVWPYVITAVWSYEWFAHSTLHACAHLCMVTYVQGGDSWWWWWWWWCWERPDSSTCQLSTSLACRPRHICCLRSSAQIWENVSRVPCFCFQRNKWLLCVCLHSLSALFTEATLLWKQLLTSQWLLQRWRRLHRSLRKRSLLQSQIHLKTWHLGAPRWPRPSPSSPQCMLKRSVQTQNLRMVQMILGLLTPLWFHSPQHHQSPLQWRQNQNQNQNQNFLQIPGEIFTTQYQWCLTNFTWVFLFYSTLYFYSIAVLFFSVIV